MVEPDSSPLEAQAAEGPLELGGIVEPPDLRAQPKGVHRHRIQYAPARGSEERVVDVRRREAAVGRLLVIVGERDQLWLGPRARNESKSDRAPAPIGVAGRHDHHRIPRGRREESTEVGGVNERVEVVGGKASIDLSSGDRAGGEPRGDGLG